MSAWRHSLSLRLALMFAIASAVLLGAFGFYMYHSLQREIAWRDDQALLGRLERMQALIDDSQSIESLRQRPQLYENMLGNRDNMLWIIDDRGRLQIEINPVKVALPPLPATTQAQLMDSPSGAHVRLAWLDATRDGRKITLVAGKLLTEREQMLSAYQMKLWASLAVGALIAFLLGWFVSQRGLRPVRQLAARAAAIDAQHLHLRLDDYREASELTALSAALNNMLGRLEDGFAQLSRFCEDLAHEMRTPLNNLMGHTQQTLRHERPVEEYQDLLVSNQEEYERLSRMIDSMLFLARTEQANAAIYLEQLNLPAQVELLCEYFEGMAEERGMRLLNQTQGQLCADAQLLRRALANILANALRYAAPDSTVTISSQHMPEHVLIHVRNHGPAIAAQHLPHLFERFYRCDPSRNEPGDSGGLGLAIVHSIMHQHGGRVTVASDDSSTCFSLALPLAPHTTRV